MSPVGTNRIDRTQLNLRMTAVELADLQAHAAARGETVTALVRRALREQIARDRLADKLARDRRAAQQLRHEWRMQDELVRKLTIGKVAELLEAEG